jgi:hypothetical protein
MDPKSVLTTVTVIVFAVEIILFYMVLAKLSID